jgi:hypothetical protein
MPPQDSPESASGMPSVEKGTAEPSNIADPSNDEIKKYDLELQDYDSESDMEDIDYSVSDL